MDNGESYSLIQAVTFWLAENWIALLALAVAIVTGIYTSRQTSLASRLARQHIAPDLRFAFDRPVDKNPIFVVSNEGYIDAEAVTAGYKVFIYLKSADVIAGASHATKMFSPGALFRHTLRPSEYESLELIGLKAHPDQVAMYVFEVRYFRPSDMQQYDRTLYFFDDGGHFVPHAEFQKHPAYRRIVSLSADVEFPDHQRNPGTLRAWHDARKHDTKPSG